jgi:hypothetical protein
MIHGSCLCGGVAFEMNGFLTPIQACHAERCRKATGAAFAPEMLTERSRFRWTRGEDLVSRYEAPLLREPPPYRRAFCRVCGSPLPIEIEGTAFVILNAGVLDGEPGSRIFRHAFVGQKACWHEITDALPQFDAQPPPPGAG